VKRS